MTEGVSPEDVRDLRRQQLFESFTPAAPVDRKDVFAGRVDQLAAVGEVVAQRGQHAVIYGERGVGKTSLAKIAREIGARQEQFTAHITCDSSDDYSAIWRKVFEEITLTEDGQGPATAARFLRADHLTPNEVRVAFRELTTVCPAVVFIDEFDVMKDTVTHRLMAETIKVFSDQAVRATVVVVGVAESVNDLIAQHESTSRNLVQVRMPRMEMNERIAIVRQGLAAADMTVTSGAERRIAVLSQGLPQIVHLIGQQAAFAALASDRVRVDNQDVRTAIRIALQDAQESVSSAYYAAVRANRDTLYPQVLLACALAAPDDRGFFTAKAVAGPLSRIMEQDYAIPAFGPHLNSLASTRGPVLRKEGEPRKFRYRFENPLMQPFVLMRGIDEGVIDFDAVDFDGMDPDD